MRRNCKLTTQSGYGYIIMKIRPQSTVVLASHNKGKLKEMQDLLAPYDIKVQSSVELGLSEPIEDGETFAENALIKARAAAQESGFIAIADDSGLCVEALDNAPGVYSARWAQTDDGERDFYKAMEKIHEQIGDNPNRKAFFISSLAVIWPEEEEEHVFEGRVDGLITWPPKGDKGFGYDPIFTPKGYEQSFAEMENEDKKSISHRGQAFEKLIKALCET